MKQLLWTAFFWVINTLLTLFKKCFTGKDSSSDKTVNDSKSVT
jgi:hypothetical protein